jgi:Domain of unknown function (DUF3576)
MTYVKYSSALALALVLGACSHHKNASLVNVEAPAKITQLGINAYLWRASLDSLAFAPLATVDSQGGVIVTEWFSNPQNPNERTKLTVYILDQELRADALRVAAERQVGQNGQWVDAPVQAATVQKVEDVILTRARDLRRAAFRG